MAYDEFDFNRALKRVIYVLIGWAVVLFVLALLASCKSVEYVPVVQTQTDTTYITKWQRDSVWLHDSIHVKERGDTVLVEKWHTKYVEKQVHDTTYVATHDTIPDPFPVETIKEVPAELSWWQKLRLWIGNIGLLALLGVVGYWGVRMWKVYHFF
jgi:hypothetical protein